MVFTYQDRTLFWFWCRYASIFQYFKKPCIDPIRKSYQNGLKQSFLLTERNHLVVHVGRWHDSKRIRLNVHADIPAILEHTCERHIRVIWLILYNASYELFYNCVFEKKIE